MGAFKQTLKKIKTIDCSGLTSVTQDGIFKSSKQYLIVGDSFYYNTTGSAMLLVLRYSGNDDTTGTYQRGAQVAQHGLASLTVQSDTTSGNGGSVIYCGNSAVESAGFMLHYKNAPHAMTDSYFSQSIGHVDGTGYRGDEQFWTKLIVRKHDGFKITFNGFTCAEGNLTIYEYNFDESEFLDNV
jgi:hypothetical protein